MTRTYLIDAGIGALAIFCAAQAYFLWPDRRAISLGLIAAADVVYLGYRIWQRR